jgi:hypothetical protein
MLRYNDDPFGEQGNKPDAWEVMKQKIQVRCNVLR